MTPTELRHAIDRLGLSQVGLATFLNVDPRTARRWAAGDLPVPRAVALLLHIMIAKRLSVARVEAISGEFAKRPWKNPPDA